MADGAADGGEKPSPAPDAKSTASPTPDDSTLSHNDDGSEDAGEAEALTADRQDDDDRDVREWETPDDELPPLPTGDDEDLSLVDPTTQLLRDHSHEDNSEDASALLERDTRRKLMDVESSFLPEPEPESVVEKPAQGADDTYLFGGSPGHTKRKDVDKAKNKHQRNKKSIAELIRKSIKEEEKLRSPPASPDSARKVQDISEAPTEEEVESRESTTTIPPSSPSAEAARRTQARKVEMNSVVDESSMTESDGTPDKRGHERQISQCD